MLMEKNIAYFVGGLIAGSLGLKALSSKSSKKACVEVAALGLRVKDCVLDTVDSLQANVDDVIAEAKVLNEEKKETESLLEEVEAN